MIENHASFEEAINALRRQLASSSRRSGAATVFDSHSSPSRLVPHENHECVILEIAEHIAQAKNPIDPVSMRGCPQDSGRGVHADVSSRTGELVCETASRAEGNVFALRDYAPGLASQAAIRMATTALMVAAPAISQWKADVDHSRLSIADAADQLWQAVKAALLAKKAAIFGSAGLAVGSEILTEVIGHFLVRGRALCHRLIRAVRHAGFPALQALQVLAWRPAGMSYRESADKALRLLVQATIVGGGVWLEHALEPFCAHLLGPKLGTEVALAASIVLCILASRIAARVLTEVDPFGLRGELELRAHTGEMRLLRRSTERTLADVAKLLTVAGIPQAAT